MNFTSVADKLEQTNKHWIEFNLRQTTMNNATTRTRNETLYQRGLSKTQIFN